LRIFNHKNEKKKEKGDKFSLFLLSLYHKHKKIMEDKQVMKETISEIGQNNSTTAMKYYSFDWDDNLMYMPTFIRLKDDKGNTVGMTTIDFAEYRTLVGKKPFNYKGHIIIGTSKDSYVEFGVTYDKQFLIDSMVSPIGPAWMDFVEAINNGSIFSIITARGHTPSTLKKAVYQLIKSNKHGIDSNKLVKNLRRYRDLADEDKLTKDQLIISYLNLCRFYPVSYGVSSEANPEEGKIKAMENFIKYVRVVSKHLQKKALMKNKISNYFTPFIGFSDDDVRNVDTMKNHFRDKEENILQTYLTSGGIKRKY